MKRQPCDKWMRCLVILVLSVLAMPFLSGTGVAAVSQSDLGPPYNWDKYDYAVRTNASGFDRGRVDKADYSGYSYILFIDTYLKGHSNSDVPLGTCKMTIEVSDVMQQNVALNTSRQDPYYWYTDEWYAMELGQGRGPGQTQDEVFKIWKEDERSWYGSDTAFTFKDTTVSGRPALLAFDQDPYSHETEIHYYILIPEADFPDGIYIIELFGRIRKSQSGSDDAWRAWLKTLPPGDNPEIIAIVEKVDVKVTKEYLPGTGQSGSTNTNAADTAGETSVPVAIAIVLGSTIAAVAGAAIASSGPVSGDSQNESGSTYRMAINKDFGDKIKWNSSPVFVYARMIEITPEGAEVDRPDLSQGISIFSTDPLLEVRTAGLSGSYMAASAAPGSAATAQTSSSAVISFMFTGAGGTFQNNVSFNVIGDAAIELPGPSLYILAASGRSFEMAFKLVNFINPPTNITVNKMSASSSFDLNTGQDASGQGVIKATDISPHKDLTSFYESIQCEIIASNEKEYARTVFSAVMCYEGILPDFLGKPPEILAYKDARGEMPVTSVAFRMGAWNENTRMLEVKQPQNVDVSFSDERGISNIVGLMQTLDMENSTGEYLLYRFQAELSLPAPEEVKGQLEMSCDAPVGRFDNLTEVKLMPDLLVYETERQEEFKHCVRIIDTYMPTRLRPQKQRELEQGFDKMGLKDLQVFRKECWNIASRSILDQQQKYLDDAAWYDEAISKAEILVTIGDLALDAALAPFGGPITGFVITNAKGLMIDCINERISKGHMGWDEFGSVLSKRLTEVVGQADGLVEMPGTDKPWLLAKWLSFYFVYRVFYHWYNDTEANGERKGLWEAMGSGCTEVFTKSIGVGLGEWTKSIAGKHARYNVGSSTGDREQEWLNQQVRRGLNAGDGMAAALDRKIAEFTQTMMDYVERIKIG